jgi:DUF917 family protein
MKETEIVLYQNNPSFVYEISRAIIESKEFNDIASFACFTMNGEAMKNTIVRNTFTRTRDIGKIIKASQGINAINFLQKLEEKNRYKGTSFLKEELSVSKIKPWADLIMERSQSKIKKKRFM